MLEPLAHRGINNAVWRAGGCLSNPVSAIMARADELGSPVAGRQIAYQVTFRPAPVSRSLQMRLWPRVAARQRGGWAERPAFFRVGERALCLAWMGQSEQAQASTGRDLTSGRDLIGHACPNPCRAAPKPR